MCSARLASSLWLLCALLLQSTASAATEACTWTGGADSGHVDPTLRHLGITPEDVWQRLLFAHPDPDHAIAVEVGSFDGAQCRLANDFAFGQVFCFEPSPINYERARDALALTGTLTSGRLMLEQLAVSNSSGGTIEFHSVGGTGDHAGALLEGEHASYRAPGATISVPTVTLDAYFQNSSASIYIVKIDVQGFDGTVLQGMRGLLAARHVQHILFELWPTAMQRATSCEDALALLLSHGYRLYELGVLAIGDEPFPPKREMHARPTDVAGLCQWYRKHSGPFGLWTDILATLQQ